MHAFAVRLTAATVAAFIAIGGLAAAARADENTPTTVPGTARRTRSTATRTDDAPAAAPVSVAVTLPLRNAGQLQQLIAAVSDPASPQYGQYLTPDAVRRAVRADRGAGAARHAYLRAAG